MLMKLINTRNVFFSLGVMFLLAMTVRGAYEPINLQTSAWDRYAVKDEEFSVVLPEVPAMATQSYNIRRTDSVRRQIILGAYAGGVVYAIFCYENPKQAEPLAYFVEDFSDSHAPGKLSFERDLQVPAVGKQYGLTRNEVRGAVRFYMTKDRAYVVEAMGAAEGEPGVDRFFSSFQIDANPRGIRMIEGPGVRIAEEQSQVPIGIGTGISGNAKTPGGPSAVHRTTEVTRKAIMVIKPWPPYTEEARKKQVMGTVVLKVVLSSSGRVTKIRAVSDLPNGLTDNAIAAAEKIRFIPATKDGRFVSMYAQLEYTFTLY